jgi:DNA polymerase III delta prime subunit
LQPEDVIDQLHEMLVSGRLLLPEDAQKEIIDNLALCDVKLQRSMHARIQFELLFHNIAEIGIKYGLATV